MTDDLRVAHISCPPGQSARGRIVVGYQQDGTELALPVLVMNGARPGPTVYMGALIHGNEPSGAEVIRQVMRERVDPSALAGRLIAIPIQNPLAFRASSYHSLEDGLNGNRIFPGDATETLTNRLVAAISRHAVEQIRDRRQRLVLVAEPRVCGIDVARVLRVRGVRVRETERARGTSRIVRRREDAAAARDLELRVRNLRLLVEHRVDRGLLHPERRDAHAQVPCIAASTESNSVLATEMTCAAAWYDCW